jgi:hypothetical protein
MKGWSSANIVTRGEADPVSPMRHLPGVKLFANDLIDDMHKAFKAVCAKLRLAPQSDKAAALVVTKIVELAKAGRKGDDLVEQTLRAFEGNEPERRTGMPLDSPSVAPSVRP